MAASKSYVVTGACAYVKVPDDEGGQRVVLLYQNQPVPDDADAASVEHNVTVGLVSEVGRDGTPKDSDSSASGSSTKAT